MSPATEQQLLPASRRLVWGSLLVALLVDLVPITASIDLLRPDLCLLVLIYWSTRPRPPASVWSGWGLGLVKDVAMLLPTGLGAGLYCLCAYVGTHLRKTFDQMALHAQMLVVALLLFAVLGLRAAGQLWLGLRWGGPLELWSPLFGALLWPLLPLLLETRRDTPSRGLQGD